MAIKLIAEDGNQRQHRRWLKTLLATTKGPVRVASAYVTNDDLLLETGKRDVRLLTSLHRMDVAVGATSLRCLRSLVKSGVRCSSLSGGPRFHAKVYVFGEDIAVVTSANLTTNALDRNIEVGVELSGLVVRELVTWFDGFWRQAEPLNLAALAKWEKETESLRRAFAALRREAAEKRPLPHEAAPSVRSRTKLQDLLSNAPRFFVCNTNRRYSPDRKDENLMRRSRHAIVWTNFNYPSHIRKVQPGDPIFMFAKSVGIIGIGRATGKVEILPPGALNRISTDHDNEEWRIPVDDWLAWADHDEDAFPWIMPNASFLDASNRHKFQQEVRTHFLRGSNGSE